MSTPKLVNGLHFNNLRGDIYGGLTAAVVALPLALAMGVSSGAGAVAGVYGAICVGFFAAIFGGTPAQVSGPTGPMPVVMAAIFAQYTAMFPDDPARGAALAFTVVMLGGGMQILFGVLRFGKFIELVPVPVVSGFMSGVGVIIILLQLPPLLGFPAQPGPMASAGVMPEAWQQLNNGVLLGLISLFLVYFLPRPIARLIPSPLVALIAGTLVAALIFGPGSVPTLGEIPTGLPSMQLPVIEFSLLPDMFVSALTLAALGSIDSLLTSLVADNVTRTYHNSDRELIGQGIGNTVAGFLGGLPGAGATMRTVVNVKAGGRTPISGVPHALVLLAIILGAGALASQIPHCGAGRHPDQGRHRHHRLGFPSAGTSYAWHRSVHHDGGIADDGLRRPDQGRGGRHGDRRRGVHEAHVGSATGQHQCLSGCRREYPDGGRGACNSQRLRWAHPAVSFRQPDEFWRGQGNGAPAVACG
ncbi:MAG: SulP family inorganic anion transporter [Sedimenticolaceae bacterium]